MRVHPSLTAFHAPPFKRCGKNGYVHTACTCFPSTMDWYKIPEIPLHKFVGCLGEIYEALEQKTVIRRGNDDLVLKAILGFETDEEWQLFEQKRRFENILEGKIGRLHEKLMGSFEGYEAYPVGHHTGCDVASTDGSILFEVKNRHNTMNHGSAKTVIANLTRHAADGKRVVLVQINCPNGKVTRYGAPACIEVMNGEQAYTLLSGRSTFFQDLVTTVAHVFKTFKTHERLFDATTQ